ncbi:MAG: lipoate--protein ligase family protein [Acidobacteria bacterium]|nr:lipoate--protein ligase family protein [Acidobacteriota bacterium]
MLVEDHGRVPPERGLALETDALDALARAAPGDPVAAERLLIWESAWPAVILPRRGEPARWVRGRACAARGVPLLHRDSGGGAVVVGPGCLTFALVLSLEARPRLADVAHSYDWLLAREAGVLAREAGGPACGGIGARSTDLALQDRKFAGHAQRRVRGGLLHHGVLLYDFDIDLIDCLLAEPSRAPAWRRGRSHREFLTNAPLTRAALVRSLRRLPAALGR